MKNTIEEAKKFLEAEWKDVYITDEFVRIQKLMVAYADQYSTPQEGRGRYDDSTILSKAIKAAKESFLKSGETDEELYKHAYRMGFSAGYNDCQNQIFTSPPEMEREWISVDERLPGVSGMYKVKRKYSEGDEIGEFVYGMKAFTNYHGYAVTHWQKISPPRSVGDKKDEV